MAQEYLTEASETPVWVEPANAILELFQRRRRPLERNNAFRHTYMAQKYEEIKVKSYETEKLGTDSFCHWPI